jgi:hypothetical protein
VRCVRLRVQLLPLLVGLNTERAPPSVHRQQRKRFGQLLLRLLLAPAVSAAAGRARARALAAEGGCHCRCEGGCHSQEGAGKKRRLPRPRGTTAGAGAGAFRAALRGPSSGPSGLSGLAGLCGYGLSGGAAGEDDEDDEDDEGLQPVVLDVLHFLDCAFSREEFAASCAKELPPSLLLQVESVLALRPSPFALHPSPFCCCRWRASAQALPKPAAITPSTTSTSGGWTLGRYWKA